MLNWLEERLRLARWSTRPRIRQGFWRWQHFPGCFAVVLAFWEIWTGLWIAPHCCERLFARGSIEWIPSFFLQSGHRWGGCFLALFVALHFLRNIYGRCYRKNREMQWLAGILSGICLSLLFFTGVFLSVPGKLEAWAEAAGFEIPAATWIYHIHVSVLPLLLLCGVALHLWLGQRRSQDSSEESL